MKLNLTKTIHYMVHKNYLQDYTILVYCKQQIIRSIIYKNTTSSKIIKRVAYIGI